MNNCELRAEKGGKYVSDLVNFNVDNIVFNKKFSDYLVICDIDLSDYKDDTQLITSYQVKYDYKYNFGFERTINLPTEKEGDVWA